MQLEWSFIFNVNYIKLDFLSDIINMKGFKLFEKLKNFSFEKR